MSETGAGPKARILVVDDDATFRRAVAKAMTRKGYFVDEARDGEVALSMLESSDQERPDVVLLDLRMPAVGGIEVLRRWRNPTPRFIVLTGHGNVTTAVEAMRLGAVNFVQKPVDMEELAPLVQDALAQTVEVNDAQQAPVDPDASAELIGECLAMRHVRQLIEAAGPTDDTVCILGETGTGKELVARALHRASPRADKPFVALNSACVSRELFDAELFGHVAGAFTGARGERKGLMREADGGTLFIDEVSELPADCQGKLLRALETREVRPVGASKELPVNVRVVAASNRDLSEEVQRGRFRNDLLFRLLVLPIVVPPLRDRDDDFPLLVEALLGRIPGGREAEVTEDALQALARHDWPGNVRELFVVLKRALLLRPPGSAPRIDEAAVGRALEASIFRAPGAITTPPLNTESVSLKLRDVEKAHLLRVYDDVKGNISEMARVLGINRRTVQRKLSGYGMRGADEDPQGAPEA